MAKKLNKKPIRQGQTVYSVCKRGVHIRCVDVTFISKYHSKAAKLSYVSDSDFYVSHSRRKAERKAKELNEALSWS